MVDQDRTEISRQLRQGSEQGQHWKEVIVTAASLHQRDDRVAHCKWDIIIYHIPQGRPAGKHKKCEDRGPSCPVVGKG